jgi:hypothetical protein
VSTGAGVAAVGGGGLVGGGLNGVSEGAARVFVAPGIKVSAGANDVVC